MSGSQINIVYEGKPLGKGRPRFGKGNTYTPAKTKNYENDLKWLAKSAMKGIKPLEGPISMMIQAFFKGKEAGGGYYIGRVDLDNIAKAAGDALNGIVYLDDRQICCLECEKLTASKEFIRITIEQLP